MPTEELDRSCHIFKVSKRNGTYRTIYSPNPEYKRKLKLLCSGLAQKVQKHDKIGVAHAFLPNRNCITNAEQHCGHAFTLSFDLKDFFDSVTPKMVKGLLNKEEIDLCFVDGAPRQGLPTSPSVANLAAIKLDKAIIRSLDRQKINAVYTRYADDLTLSFDRKDEIEPIKKIVKQSVSRCGFKLNAKKTKLQQASDGRIIVTGVGIDADGVHPTRKTTRKLRAAKHQDNTLSAMGLNEWAKCKKPKEKVFGSVSIDDVYELSKNMGMGLRKADCKRLPRKETEKIGNNCVISGDPMQMLGMSAFTTGWASCMAPGRCRRKGVGFWLLLKGTRIAYQHNNKLKSIGGVERDQMISRCLVHELRNGVLVYDRFYGNNTKALEKQLKKHGVISMSEARKKYRGAKVVGNVPHKYRPYFDNLRTGTGTLPSSGKRVRFAKI